MSRFSEIQDHEVDDLERAGFSDPSNEAMFRSWETSENELIDIGKKRYPIMHRALLELLGRCGVVLNLKDPVLVVEISPEYGEHFRFFQEIKAPILYRGYGFSKAIRDFTVERVSGIPYAVVPWREPFGAIPIEGARVVVVNCLLSKTVRWPHWIAEAARISSEWVIFHRVQYTFLKTAMYRKSSSVPSLDIRLNEADVISEIRKNKMKLAYTQMIYQEQVSGCRSYLARKA